MDIDARASALVAYINSLEDFKLETPGYPYGHMGATITDAMLQAGLTYETTVKPRVRRVRLHEDASTTTGFLGVLDAVGRYDLLDWSDSEKPSRILNVAGFLQRRHLEREDQLADWLIIPGNVAEFRRLRGIGPKTLDYFKMLVGLRSVAIDRHLMSFLDDAHVPYEGYDDARSVIMKAAQLMEVPETVLDHSIWKYKSDKKRRGAKC